MEKAGVWLVYVRLFQNGHFQAVDLTAVVILFPRLCGPGCLAPERCAGIPQFRSLQTVLKARRLTGSFRGVPDAAAILAAHGQVLPKAKIFGSVSVCQKNDFLKRPDVI